LSSAAQLYETLLLKRLAAGDDDDDDDETWIYIAHRHKINN